MAGYIPGDPYNPAYVANGWISEEEEEPVENEEEEPVEHEEEEPMEDEEEEPMEEGDEPEPESENESSDEEVDIGEVIDGPRPAQRRELPPPPPAARDEGPPPRWAIQLHNWSRELGLRSPYGRSRAYFDLSAGTSADRALPVLIGQASRMDAQTGSIWKQLMDVGAENRVTAVRVRRLDEQQGSHHDVIETLRRDHAAMAARLLSFEERMVAMEQRTMTAETMAATTEVRTITAEARTAQPEARAVNAPRHYELSNPRAPHYG